MTIKDRSAASRIRLYKAIEEAMVIYPDLRVGQLMSVVTDNIFYIENDDLTQLFKDYAQRNRNK